MPRIAQAPSIAQALRQAQADGLERPDAQRLLGHLLQRERAWLIAHDDQALNEPMASAFADGCRRCAAGEPLAYVIGEQHFYGLRLLVTSAVLVPRPDTETLVDLALALLPTLARQQPRVLDLGTGSGAIALAVAQGHGAATVTATDISADALTVARANAQRLSLSIDLAQGAWWQAVAAEQRFDLVLSNPPYIAADDANLSALQHEPLIALSPGGDGLDAYRQIIAGAAAHLAPGGWLLFEHGWQQADAVSGLLRQAGFSRIDSRRDLAGRVRCTGGCLAPD